MNPAQILAILAWADAAISGYEHALGVIARLREDGLVTAEQQQALLDRVADSRRRVGLPVNPPPPQE